MQHCYLYRCRKCVGIIANKFRINLKYPVFHSFDCPALLLSHPLLWLCLPLGTFLLKSLTHLPHHHKFLFLYAKEFISPQFLRPNLLLEESREVAHPRGCQSFEIATCKSFKQCGGQESICDSSPTYSSLLLRSGPLLFF